MGYVFWIIGTLIIFNAVSSTAETSIHQIYIQLQYLTGFISIGLGHIIIKLNGIAKCYKPLNELRNLAQKTVDNFLSEDEKEKGNE